MTNGARSYSRPTAVRYHVDEPSLFFAGGFASPAVLSLEYGSAGRPWKPGKLHTGKETEVSRGVATSEATAIRKRSVRHRGGLA